MTEGTHPTDDSSSLGDFLRQERERRGITIEQVASATKIGIRVLHSLEENHYGDLPAKPFIRGFVTSYVRFIGLDSKEVLARFDSFIDSKLDAKPNRESAYSGYAFEKREGEQSRTFLWIVMGSFIVGGGLVMAVFKPSLKHHHQSHADKLRAVHGSPTPDQGDDAASGPTGVVTPSPSPGLFSHGPFAPVPVSSSTASPLPLPSVSPVASPMPSSSPSPLSAPSATPSASPSPTAVLATNGKPDPLRSGADLMTKDVHYKVVFKALADVVVRFRVDDKAMNQFKMKKDKVLVLKAHELIRFQISNPKSMTFTVNGSEDQLIEDADNVTMHQKTATLTFSRKKTGSLGEPFPGEAPLPHTASPD